MAEISVTLKAGASYQDEWVGIKAGSVAELSEIITALRTPDEGLSPLQGIRYVAAEFRTGTGPTDSALAAVKQQFPDAVEVQPQAAPQAPPMQSTPACTKCGKPTRFKSGTSRSGGPYKGFACTADRNHFDYQN